MRSGQERGLVPCFAQPLYVYVSQVIHHPFLYSLVLGLGPSQIFQGITITRTHLMSRAWYLVTDTSMYNISRNIEDSRKNRSRGLEHESKMVLKPHPHTFTLRGYQSP